MRLFDDKFLYRVCSGFVFIYGKWTSSLCQPRARAEQYADNGRPVPLQCQPAPVLPVAPLLVLLPTALSSSPRLLPLSPSMPKSLPPTPPSLFPSSPLSSDPGLLHHLFSLPRRQVELETGRSDLLFPFVSLRACHTTLTLLSPSTSSHSLLRADREHAPN
jgi:hypothetical protein